MLQTNSRKTLKQILANIEKRNKIVRSQGVSTYFIIEPSFNYFTNGSIVHMNEEDIPNLINVKEYDD